MSGATARRAQHRQELRSDILDAAREIFVTDGYDGFSMRKLAERVGYSPAALYLHFEDKEQLFDALVEQSFARLYGALASLQSERGKDPVRQLKRGFRAYVDWGLAHPNEYAIAFVLRRPASPMPYRTHPAFDVARALVKRCLPPLSTVRKAELAAQAVWAAAHGITALLIQRPAFPWVVKGPLIDRVIDSAVDGSVARGTAHRGGFHAKRR